VAEAAIVVTAGSGTDIHSNTRTIAATTKHDQFVLPGEFPYASYTVAISGYSIATAGDHILQIMAGASLNVRIRRVWLEQAAHATSVSIGNFQLMRVTTAGTGGTAVTPGKMDTSDAASGATAMTLPSSKGTESTLIRPARLIMRQAIAATVTQPEEAIDFDFRGVGFKSLIIAAGTSNGIVMKNVSAVAGCTVDMYVEFIETAFV